MSFGLSVTDVADAAFSAFDVPAGSLRSTDQRLIVRADATAITEDQVENIIVSGDTRIGDVAQAYFAPADANSFVHWTANRLLVLVLYAGLVPIL